jgi:hypothetical protein
MVARKRLQEIAWTRNVLILEADLQRALVTAELQQLKASLAWVDSIRRAASAAAPVAPWVGSWAAALAGGRMRTLWRWIAIGCSAARMAGRLRRFW